jgi:hypothetical protein
MKPSIFFSCRNLKELRTWTRRSRFISIPCSQVRSEKRLFQVILSCWLTIDKISARWFNLSHRGMKISLISSSHKFHDRSITQQQRFTPRLFNWSRYSWFTVPARYSAEEMPQTRKCSHALKSTLPRSWIPGKQKGWLLKEAPSSSAPVESIYQFLQSHPIFTGRRNCCQRDKRTRNTRNKQSKNLTMTQLVSWTIIRKNVVSEPRNCFPWSCQFGCFSRNISIMPIKFSKSTIS